jgi:hypothetical protein
MISKLMWLPWEMACAPWQVFWDFVMDTALGEVEMYEPSRTQAQT